MPGTETSDKKWWSVKAEDVMTVDKRYKKEDIQALRTWLEKQPHLPPVSDEQLLVFLAACNFSLELSKKTIDINYTLRTKNPRMWKDRELDNPILNDIRDKIQIGVLPHKKGHPAIFMYKVLPMDASLYDVELILRIAYMVQDLSQLLEGPNPEGYIFIIDMANVTLGHILRNPLTLFATALKYAQEGSCCTIRGFHFMNSGPVLETFLNMLKPFINADVWKLIKAHEKTTGLDKHLDLDEIPKDYHGTGPSIEELCKNYYNMIREYRPWFIYEETLRVDESKRPPDNKTADGLQGSFRKLDLD
ncbi:alpha-tocopherol transfer protein [Halyomorpha halys]|uniref:alpha-tocopherol transfer protein n=1 Tax=Halyomorpha halys TaxID=286706 RepID=UPI0006D51EF9|nr:alpha-tocopherol transfer protein-like [Halyomorpha halys]